jgi:hypothetical protein
MSNKQLLTNLIDKSEELDLLIIRLSLLEQSNKVYNYNPMICDIEINKEKYFESIAKIKSMIEIQKEKVDKRRHPLSDVPGGSTLTIVKNDGSVQTMTNVKFPKKYTDAVLNNKQNEIKSICDERGHYWHIKY